MKMYHYSFDRKDFNDSFTFRQKVPNIDYSLEDLAEEMAEDYYDNHDGWEYKDWPYDIYIWDEDGKYLGASTVHMEYSPNFYAYPKKEKENVQSP
jgi:hypothetical protein